jgi:ABC-type lipoprotein release transport system permease subunit
VSRFVLGRALVLTMLGLGGGLAAALMSMPLLDAAPVTIGRPGVPTVVVVATMIAGVAVLAALVPARRAARVDPVAMLRAD